MRTYAIVEEGVVTEIAVLTEEQFIERTRTCLGVDIEDEIPRPQVGWKLDGNRLVPVSESSNPDELDAIQQKSQRLFGMKLLPMAVDLVGARNLKLSREGTPANVTALASQMQVIKLLLEGGALKTTRTVCESLKPSFPLHEDILQTVINEITNFLDSNGWN